MNNLRCNSCLFLNFASASACKRCGLPFDSSTEMEWNSQHASSETYPQPTENGSFFWDQPSASRQKYALPPVTTSSGMAKIVKIFIVLAVLFGISTVAIPKLLKGGKADYSNLSWNEYRSPDGKFSVSLPATPKMSERAVPSTIGTAQAHLLEATMDKSSTCMLLYADYPVERINMSEETLYEQALQGAAQGSNMLGIGSKKYVTLNGYRGMEAELKPTPESKADISGTARLFWVTPRLYVLVAAGPKTAEFRAVQTRCLESFKLLRSN